jgi:hypothetical protein
LTGRMRLARRSARARGPADGLCEQDWWKAATSYRTRVDEMLLNILIQVSSLA